MKNLYLTLMLVLAVTMLKASPDIYTPELIAPANNATGVFPDAELDWNAVTGDLGLYYEVNLDTTSSFTNPVVFTTDLTNYKMSMLLFNQTYYWRVRAIDNSGSSDWSEPRSFTVINTVIIRRPSENAASVDANVQIIWQDIYGVSFVDYQLDTTANFNSPMMSITSVVNNPTSSQTNASSLHFGQKYFLRMRARHALDTSAWSAARNFTVVNNFALKTPNAGTTGLSPDVEFTWNKINGLLKYQIRLSKDPNITQYEAYNVAPNLLKFSPDTLLFGTTYYWQMAAIHAHDTLLSEIRDFTTVGNVTLTSPSNNSTNVELQPTLTWQTLTGLVSFQLDIARNSDFTNAFSYNINSGGENTFKVPIHVLDSANVYYWRVRALSSRDTSEFSDTWSFRCVALGMEDATPLKYGVKIYPSPAANRVNISVKNTFNGNAQVEVYDLLGSKRMSETVNFINGFHKDFGLSELSNGIYMISIIIDGQRSTTKLIIQK